MNRLIGRHARIEQAHRLSPLSHNRNSCYACGTAVFVNARLIILVLPFLEVAMNISNVSMRAIPGTQADVHSLEVHPLMATALLCGLVWTQLSAWRLSAWI
jgi:hypothetical protein